MAKNYLTCVRRDRRRLRHPRYQRRMQSVASGSSFGGPRNRRSHRSVRRRSDARPRRRQRHRVGSGDGRPVARRRWVSRRTGSRNAAQRRWRNCCAPGHVHAVRRRHGCGVLPGWRWRAYLARRPQYLPKAIIGPTTHAFAASEAIGQFFVTHARW